MSFDSATFKLEGFFELTFFAISKIVKFSNPALKLPVSIYVVTENHTAKEVTLPHMII